MRALSPSPAASPAGRSAWRRYGLALLCVAAAFVTQRLLSRWLPSTPSIVFLAGVLLATRISGRGPGWLATGVSALLAQAFPGDASGAARPVAPEEALLLLGVGGLAAALGAHAPPSSSGNASPAPPDAPRGPPAPGDGDLEAAQRQRLERTRAELLARERAVLAEVEAQRDRLEALLQQAPVAITVFRGPDHRCELLNPHALELIDARGPVIGRPLREVMPHLNGGLLRLVDDVFQTAIPFSGREVPMLLEPPSEGAAMGSGRYFDVTWQPWRAADGAIQGVMAIAVEVTKTTNARRTAEALAVEAQEALRIRDEFLSVASHELRTPITSLQLQLELLLRSMPRDDAEAGTPSLVRRRVDATMRSVARLHQLVATLLDVSRIRAGRLDVRQEPVNLSALVQEVAARSQEEAASARCPLVVEVDAGVVGHWDRLRLEQVITNLLSNAFKYGAQHPVEVRVTREGDQARLTVRDYGIGIAPEDHERIFQRFERAVSERHYGGFGLGLWIVRRILESLSGDIQVRSQRGQGATFIVRLPLRPADSAVA